MLGAETGKLRVSSKLTDLFTRLEDLNVGFCGLMETNIFGEDLSEGKYQYLHGPELLPILGGSVARRGLGAFIDKERFPGASAVWSGVHSFCVKIPALAPNNCPMIVITTHIPMLRDRVDRQAAFDELTM